MGNAFRLLHKQAPQFTIYSEADFKEEHEIMNVYLRSEYGQSFQIVTARHESQRPSYLADGTLMRSSKFNHTFIKSENLKEISKFIHQIVLSNAIQSETFYLTTNFGIQQITLDKENLSGFTLKLLTIMKNTHTLFLE